MEWKPVLQGTYGPNMNAFWWVAVEMWTFVKIAYRTVTVWQECGRAHWHEADDRGDYTSSPCTLYKRAKKCRSKSGKTFQQFTTCMKSYFTWRIDMSGIEKTFENLHDLILRDQLTFTGNSRYVDLAYLDTITYVEGIFHSQHFFFIYLNISTLSMSKTVNMKQWVISRWFFMPLTYFL